MQRTTGKATIAYTGPGLYVYDDTNPPWHWRRATSLKEAEQHAPARTLYFHDGDIDPHGAVFYVRDWDSNRTLDRTYSLEQARRLCRDKGHTGDHNGKWYLPIAYVENELGEIVYNPQFKYTRPPAVTGKAPDWRAPQGRN
jgi:hypothetical protein